MGGFSPRYGSPVGDATHRQAANLPVDLARILNAQLHIHIRWLHDWAEAKLPAGEDAELAVSMLQVLSEESSQQMMALLATKATELASLLTGSQDIKVGRTADPS